VTFETEDNYSIQFEISNNSSSIRFDSKWKKHYSHSTSTGPWYLAANCVPVSEMAQKRHLRSAAGHQLVVPSYHLNLRSLWAFSILGLRLWNPCLDCCVTLGYNTTSCGHSLKTFYLSEY